MPTGRASTQRATPRASHGDVTGNLTQSLRKEHAAEVRAAQQRMSTVSPAVEPADPFVEQDRAADEDEQALIDEAVARSEELSRSGITVEALPRERPRRSLRSVSKEGKLDPNELVEVRFLDDFPGVTYGKSPEGELRTFDFEAGRRYKIPRHMADHLADKEMLA